MDLYNIADPAWAPIAPLMVPIIVMLTEGIKAAVRTRWGADAMAGFAALIAIADSIVVGLLAAAFINRPLVAGIWWGLVACAFGVLIHTVATSPARARETKALKVAARVQRHRRDPDDEAGKNA
jgi:predicted small integral membrane protein